VVRRLIWPCSGKIEVLGGRTDIKLANTTLSFAFGSDHFELVPLERHPSIFGFDKILAELPSASLVINAQPLALECLHRCGRGILFLSHWRNPLVGVKYASVRSSIVGFGLRRAKCFSVLFVPVTQSQTVAAQFADTNLFH
jgi:hypothetical protein